MAEKEKPFDLVVIGGGPGGYVAALRASQLGFRTALVERDQLGGVCLNWGCIPTKALLHAADTLRRIRRAGDLGILVSEPQVDFERVIQRSREVSLQLNRGVAHLLKKAGVQVFSGVAELVSARGLQVTPAEGEPLRLSGRHILVATGARARELELLPFDGDRVWSYRDALSVKHAPSSLVVVGSGAIGMEFASFFATLGTRVTVLEAAPRLLPSGDEEISQFMHKAFSKEGIRCLTGITLVGGNVHQDGVTLSLKYAGEDELLHADRVLVAIGLKGNSEGLGLSRTRAIVENGLIQVGDWGQTREPGLYAIGDVTGAPMLAHKASHQAVAAVEHMAGLRQGAQLSAVIPACVYSHPQSAAVGMTEAQARQTGIDVKVGKFPLQANGKALAIDEGEGFIKTIFNAATGELLGTHLVGPESTELVHGFTIAATLESTEAELMDTVFPHPTLSEAMHEAVLAAYGRAVHI